MSFLACIRGPLVCVADPTSIRISDLFRWGRADAVVLLLGPFAGYGRVQPAHLALRATLPYSVLHCIHYPRIRLSVRCSQGGQPPHGTPQVRRAFSQLAGIAICCSSSIGHGQRHVVKRRGVFWNRNLFVHETADCELPLAIISGLLAVATDKSLTKKHRHIAH